MPFVSSSQRRKFYADPRLHKYIKDFEAHTPEGKKLPKHARYDKQRHKMVAAFLRRHDGR